MKSKMQQLSMEEKEPTGNEQVRREIQSFLQALNSYPDRFARNPRISFEEHCIGLVQAKSESRRRA